MDFKIALIGVAAGAVYSVLPLPTVALVVGVPFVAVYLYRAIREQVDVRRIAGLSLGVIVAPLVVLLAERIPLKPLDRSVGVLSHEPLSARELVSKLETQGIPASTWTPYDNCRWLPPQERMSLRRFEAALNGGGVFKMEVGLCGTGASPLLGGSFMFVDVSCRRHRNTEEAHVGVYGPQLPNPALQRTPFGRR